MNKGFLLAFAVVLLASLAWAVPGPPSDLDVELHPRGIFISWAHSQAGLVSFNIYRGPSEESTELIATTGETSYLDTGVEPGKQYWYFITAEDETGEGPAVSFNITSPSHQEKPFTVSLVEPTETTFRFEEEVEFVVQVESSRFEELQGLKATIFSEGLGVKEEMYFDSNEKKFYALVKMPEAQEEGFSANFSINVSATFDGVEYVEPITGPIVLIPEKVGFWIIGPVEIIVVALIVLVVVGAFAWNRWSARMKVQKDALRLQLSEIDKERLLWRREAFKRKITEEQFKEKEGMLQSKQAAIEEKLGFKRVKGVPRKNVFEGFAPAEAEEAMRLVKSIGKPKKGETPESLRARLVGLGRSEKIAKKVVELIKW